MIRRTLVVVAALLALPTVAAAQPAETIEYYQADLVGSIRIVYDGAGNVIGRQDYTPFGTPVLNGTSLPKEAFGGNENDDETQEMYFHARSLATRAGRFMQPDVVFDAMSDPQAWNRYSYARNNSIVLVDPYGDDPCPVGSYYCVPPTCPPHTICRIVVAPPNPFTGQPTAPIPTGPGVPTGPTSGSVSSGGGGAGVPTTTTTTTPTTTPTPNPNPSPNPNPNCDPHNPATCGPSAIAATVKGFFKGGFSDCLGVFAASTLDDLWGIGPGLASTARSVGEGTAVSGYALAYGYAASRPSVLGDGGLLFPMKSRIFAPIFRAARFMEGKAVPVAAEALALGHGLYDEYNAAATGQCGR